MGDGTTRNRIGLAIASGATLALALVPSLSWAVSPRASLRPTLLRPPQSRTSSRQASQSQLFSIRSPETSSLPPEVSLPISVPAISGDTDCAAGDGWYSTPTVANTYHNRSFYGTPGTFTGNWPRRNAWDSGSYTASVCWERACSQEFEPNSYVTVSGSIVTGTSFTIY